MEKERKLQLYVSGLLNVHNKLRSIDINECPNSSKLKQRVWLVPIRDRGKGEVKRG